MEIPFGQKGPVSPPPVLKAPFQSVSDAVASWSGVTALTHWHLSRNGTVDGADYYVGNRELGHIHLNGEVHLATDAVLNARFLSEGRAEKFPFGGSYACWTLFRISSPDDAAYAVKIFRLNYQRVFSETTAS